MHRQPLLQLLRQHKPADPNEQAMTQATLAFVEVNPAAFERSLPDGTPPAPAEVRLSGRPGHITGSAWIVSPDRRQTLLIHHRKLDRWLQPGGHADGDPDVAAVALREAQEETGLTSLRLVYPANSPALPYQSPPIFDVDVHTIPARNDEPEHLHYDIRFLVEADSTEGFGVSDEIKNIRWLPLSSVIDYANSESIFRLLRKSR